MGNEISKHSEKRIDCYNDRILMESLNDCFQRHFFINNYSLSKDDYLILYSDIYYMLQHISLDDDFYIFDTMKGSSKYWKNESYSIVCNAWEKIIRDKINSFPIQDQGSSGICWSYAIASAIYFSYIRILGRKTKSFDQIHRELIESFGEYGQNTEDVMRIAIPKYGLHYEKVGIPDLMIITNKCRVCVARFQLNEEKWINFFKFFRNPENKKKAITFEDINKEVSPEEIGDTPNEKSGHSVVLVKATPNEWLFRNSWGESWADDGYFRVKPQAFNIDFYEVYWTEKDLSKKERKLWNDVCNYASSRFITVAFSHLFCNLD